MKFTCWRLKLDSVYVIFFTQLKFISFQTFFLTSVCVSCNTDCLHYWWTSLLFRLQDEKQFSKGVLEPCEYFSVLPCLTCCPDLLMLEVTMMDFHQIAEVISRLSFAKIIWTQIQRLCLSKGPLLVITEMSSVIICFNNVASLIPSCAVKWRPTCPRKLMLNCKELILLLALEEHFSHLISVSYKLCELERVMQTYKEGHKNKVRYFDSCWTI